MIVVKYLITLYLPNFQMMRRLGIIYLIWEMDKKVSWGSKSRKTLLWRGARWEL